MSAEDGIELASLVGDHVLDAVDASTEKIKQWGDHFEDCEVIRFRLDGKVYTAIEDPSDGYRSMMSHIFVSDDPISNTFPPCNVLAKMKEPSKYETHETLQLVDRVTGKIVLEVGTDNHDDYYPCFVSSFNPENMAINAGK